MTKLTKQNTPGRNVPMYYCKRCREWVPEENKHNKKRHDGVRE